MFYRIKSIFLEIIAAYFASFYHQKQEEDGGKLAEKLSILQHPTVQKMHKCSLKEWREEKADFQPYS